MSESLAGMRRQYARAGLLEQDCPADPLQLFADWMRQAVISEQPPVEANAMVLSTLDAQGRPHSRVMLLKELDERGFVFYTNYESDKGRELAVQPEAALLFFWPSLERQVRIEGRVEQVPTVESDAYYDRRPLGSRLGAWASAQSCPLESREQLEVRLAEVTERFAGNEQPPRPSHWGGYVLVPRRIEFWQGRPSRLHDRIDYRSQPDGGWSKTRLSP